MAFNYEAFYRNWRKNHAIPRSDRWISSVWDAFNVRGKTPQYQTLAYNLARLVAFKFKVSPILPYDTGNFMKNGIVPLPSRKNSAKVRFGNQHVPYAYYLNFNEFVGATQRPNRHFGFVEKVIESGLLNEIELVATQNIYNTLSTQTYGFNVLYAQFDPWRK